VPKVRVFPVSDLFEMIETQFGAAFDEQGLKLRIARSSQYLRSDPALLRRILQNFVSNARRYTPDGGVLIGCRRRGEYVAIQVVDTGVGIAPEDHKVIFEEFKRLGGRSKRAKRGLGLGLAIVERIAKLLGHPIAMRSELGKGSTFEVLVPRASARESLPNLAKRLERQSASSLDGRFVLCIDNEHTILDGMQGLLSKWGARPIIAADLESARSQLKAVREEHDSLPSMFIVDYHLDDAVTGIDVLKGLRADAGIEIPAIIVTADHTEQVRDEVRAFGDSILHKPIKPAALRALMTRILSRV